MDEIFSRCHLVLSCLIFFQCTRYVFPPKVKHNKLNIQFQIYNKLENSMWNNEWTAQIKTTLILFTWFLESKRVCFFKIKFIYICCAFDVLVKLEAQFPFHFNITNRFVSSVMTVSFWIILADRTSFPSSMTAWISITTTWMSLWHIRLWFSGIISPSVFFAAVIIWGGIMLIIRAVIWV